MAKLVFLSMGTIQFSFYTRFLILIRTTHLFFVTLFSVTLSILPKVKREKGPEHGFALPNEVYLFFIYDREQIFNKCGLGELRALIYRIQSRIVFSPTKFMSFTRTRINNVHNKLRTTRIIY